MLDVADVDMLSLAIARNDPPDALDLNNDRAVDHSDLEYWITELKTTYFGDVDLDGEFNTRDLVAVFQAGHYEDKTSSNSHWATGDWNADQEFTSLDLAIAFQSGGFKKGSRSRSTSVPEPAAAIFLIGGFISILGGRRRAWY